MKLLLLPVLFAALASGALAQAPPQQQTARELSESEQSLVRGSREAILAAGITPAYFDEHFRLARVVDTPGDRRVVWTFTVGGYEATISDAVGFYTEGGRRVYTHSVADTLPSARDITRTITRRRAEAVMRRCIGNFTNARVEYRAHGPDGAAALLLTAQRIIQPRAGAGRAARERREREQRQERELRERARGQEAGGAGRTGGVKREEDDEGSRPVILLGAVDLVTGRCEAGRAQSTP